MTKLTHRELSNAVIVWFVVIFISALLFAAVPYWPTQVGNHLPLAREDFDFNIYWQGARWLSQETLPYQGKIFDLAKEENIISSGNVPFVAEAYPQLAMMYFTVPALFANNLSTYMGLFFAWNSFWFLLLLVAFKKILKFLKIEGVRFYWIFLPSFLFFLFNRYDIFPATLVMWALLLLLEKKFNWSLGILALSIMAKIYPIILLPIFLLYIKQNSAQITKPLLVFGLTITIPLTIFGLWTGWLTTLAPYFIHFTHETKDSLLYLLQQLIPWQYMKWLLGNLFIFFKLALPLFIFTLLFWPKKYITQLGIKPPQLLSLIALTLLIFIVLNDFYSNQWIIWILPLLLLSIPTKQIWLVLPYDFLNYLHYPLIFALHAMMVKKIPINLLDNNLASYWFSSLYYFIILLQAALLFLFGYIILQQIKPLFKLNKINPI